MGISPSFPNLSLNFKSTCCHANEKDETEKVRKIDGENMAQSKRPRWLRRSIKADKKNEADKTKDNAVVKRSTSV